MKTEVLTVDPRHPDVTVLRRAAAILRRGGLVAFPTETVYGLGASALMPEAIERLYAAKGRPAFNPLIVHVTGEAQARRVVAGWPEEAEALAARFWPGPLTLVLPKPGHLPDIVTAGLGTVAVRAPSHPVARALIDEAGIPLAAPSANRSGSISPTRAEHVLRTLDGRIDMVLDAGPTEVGIESTVVALSPARLLRLGHVGRAELEAVIGPVSDETRAASDEPASPGMLLRHYAPEAVVVMVARGDARALAAALAGEAHTGAILHSLPARGQDQIRLPDEPAAYAQGLYAALHQLDERCDRIVVEAPPESAAWDAVCDRLRRAAHADDDTAPR